MHLQFFVSSGEINIFPVKGLQFQVHVSSLQDKFKVYLKKLITQYYIIGIVLLFLISQQKENAIKKF